MRTSFHHQPEAQHPIFQLSTSWQADYPIFRGIPDTRCSLTRIIFDAIDPKPRLLLALTWRRLCVSTVATCVTCDRSITPIGIGGILSVPKP
jgi:hypothetical protein